MQVSFVVGGTQKGGTSALDAFLRQHPQICMAEDRKEVHFFDTEENFATGAPNYSRYHALFSPNAQHRVIGETTPNYMYWEPAPPRIWSYNSAMKWILVLREPVSRAFSHWNMKRARGAEPLPFAAALEREDERSRAALPLQGRSFSYLGRGYYAHQVRRLFSIFGRENCLVLLTADLRDNHGSTLRKVFEFLGVDPHFAPPAQQVFGHSYEAQIDEDIRLKLLDLFYFDVRELERLIDRDLSHWTIG
jgi:hypothetical protein